MQGSLKRQKLLTTRKMIEIKIVVGTFSLFSAGSQADFPSFLPFFIMIKDTMLNAKDRDGQYGCLVPIIMLCTANILMRVDNGQTQWSGQRG